MSHVVYQNFKMLTNQQITGSVVLINQIGAIDICTKIKPRWQQSVDATRLLFILGCTNIKDILDNGREAVKLSKKIVRAPFLRLIKALWQANIRCELVQDEKFITSKGTYKPVHMMTSKDFRETKIGKANLLPPKLNIDLNVHNDNDRQTIKSYFSVVKRLANTRHKNTLLRIWNGDCLSNTRLVHLGIVDTNFCPNCNMVDTPRHLLVECVVAVKTWTSLMAKIPKSPH
jgi:hypothetical protein